MHAHFFVIDVSATKNSVSLHSILESLQGKNDSVCREVNSLNFRDRLDGNSLRPPLCELSESLRDEPNFQMEPASLTGESSIFCSFLRV
jgi:hypothetical protein